MAKKVAKKKVSKKISSKKKSSTPAKLKVGDLAPNFTLLNQNSEEVSLNHFRGKKVLVYFYPRALTPGCTVQACGLRDAEKKLKKEKLVVLGISGDPVKKLKQFEEKHELNFQLLSDPDHQVSELFGSWGLKKFMGREFEGILRQSFLVDENGVVSGIMEKVNTATHHEDIFDLVKNLE